MKKSLGHYEVIDKLGAGGMGEVYRVHDTILDRQLALKVLRFEPGTDPLYRRRINREARAIASLDHPNIVKVFSVEEFEGVHFFTMELVCGSTLSDLYLQDGFSLSRFLDIALPLASGISCAHSHGVTHHDLKPNNILVNRIEGEARLKIVDFGLARLPHQSPAGVDGPRGGSPSPAGRVFGTVAYMSPEQAQGKPSGPTSDVFSLGVIMYEILTGEAPFRGDNAAATIESVLTEDPPPLLEVRPDLPPALSSIVARCLLKDARLRYSSAIPLHGDLKNLAESQSAAGPEARREQPGVSSLRENSIFLEEEERNAGRVTGDVPPFVGESVEPVFG
ncbi:MAG: serine/threonine protein kinase, partial [Gemmatimonadetes bacterium]|nr:serine/threonine protein kinase [Gemmatimonadota bacterium]